MSDVRTWSTTASENNATPPDGWPEGMPPSAVNDSARENMAAVKRLYNDITGVGTATGSSNAYALAASQEITSYAAGNLFVFRANHTNTGAATLNVNGIGAKAIRKDVSAVLNANDILNGNIVIVVYDANNDRFQLISNTSPVTGQNTWSARQLFTGGFRTAQFAISDDAVATLDITGLLSAAGNASSLIIFIQNNGVGSNRPNGMFRADDGATGATAIAFIDATNLTFSNVVLNGTTGDDNKFNFSTASSTLYLENRSGTAMTCNITVMT